MPLDVLTPSPLKLHVRGARASADGQQTMYELVCRLTTLPATGAGGYSLSSRFHSSMALSHGGDSSTSTTEWTLWKTFEDFQSFDQQMRARSSTFSRMMVPVAFAPVHKVRVFFHQDSTTSFAEKRRKELDYYMQRILMLSDVGDFVGGHGSSVLATFLHASHHVDCHSSLAASGHDHTPLLSPSSTTSSASNASAISRHGLRDLHVDLRRAYSPATTHGGHEYGDDGDGESEDDAFEPKTRKQLKQEIEDKLLDRRGESDLKLFKKRANAFRKQNDVQHAAHELVGFLNDHFGQELGKWVLVRLAHSLRNDEQRVALLTAGGLRNESKQKIRNKTRTASSSSSSSSSFVAVYDQQNHQQQQHQQQPPAPALSSSSTSKSSSSSSSLKRSKKEVLARVEKLAGGDAERVAAFKRAARALGNYEMTTDEFVAFLHSTFNDRDAQRVLKMVAEVVPARLQQELINAVRRP